VTTQFTTTQASNVDAANSLGGITVYNYNLYATITGAVLKYTIDPITLSLSSTGVFSGSTSTFGISDGTYLTTKYTFPNYITHDGAGNLYIGDHANTDPVGETGDAIDSIRRLSIQNGNVTTMAGKTGLANCFLFSLLFSLLYLT